MLTSESADLRMRPTVRYRQNAVKSRNALNSGTVMTILDAIYKRRSIREYTVDQLDRSTVSSLIEAAIQAPSMQNRQPWAFVIIQDRDLLCEMSESAKRFLRKRLEEGAPLGRELQELLHYPDYDLFYEAGTLILICSRPGFTDATMDCSFAAQNLMLAAAGMGLGTCPIGLALPWIGSPEGRRELGIPEGYDPVLPIIVGYVARPAPPESRKAPRILSWRRRPESGEITR